MGRSTEGPDAVPILDQEMLNLSEKPEHEVFVDAFALDTFPVTVGRFRAFALAFDGTAPAEGSGAHPSIPGSGWHSAWNLTLPPSQAALLADLEAPVMIDPLPYPHYPPFLGSKTWTTPPGDNDDRPIDFIDWHLAFAFCIWDGGRLPTEAEWECAAAGGDQNCLHPWGAAPPDAAHLATGPQTGLPGHVGQFPEGKGRWGHLDLISDVGQWVLDWYQEDWYALHSAPDSCHNCANLTEAAPESGPFHVSRGGYDDRAADRGTVYDDLNFTNGFRCARSP
jgi:formylglycine-generating enzyme required for sulfatase activity